MTIAVVQAYEAPATPRWIECCVASVRNWAGAKGFQHHFLREGFFGLAPEWFRARCGAQIGPVTDVSRLYLMRRFFSMGYEAVVWVDADVLVFDPERLDVRSETGFVALKEITVGVDQGGVVHVSPVTVNGALIASRRDHPLFEFYLYAVETAVRQFRGPEIPRTIAGPELLTRISQAVPIECLTTVGLFTPAILQDIASGSDRLPRIFAEQFGHRVAAANLCHFFRDTVTPEQRSFYDELMDRAMGRLIETRGEIVNRFAPPDNSAARP
jgi:hypothetical protein